MSLWSAVVWLGGSAELGCLSPVFQCELAVVGLGWPQLGQLANSALLHKSHLPTGLPGCVLREKAEV